jgi:hypothetical protein
MRPNFLKQALQEAMEYADDYKYVLTNEQLYEKRGAKEALSELYFLIFDEVYHTARDIRTLEGAE